MTCTRCCCSALGKYCSYTVRVDNATVRVSGCIDTRFTDYTNKYIAPPPRAYWQRLEGWKEGYEIARVWCNVEERWVLLVCNASISGTVKAPKGETKVIRVHGIFNKGADKSLRDVLRGKELFGWYIDDVVRSSAYKYIPLLGEVFFTLDIIVVKVGSLPIVRFASVLVTKILPKHLGKLLIGIPVIIVSFYVIDTLREYIEYREKVVDLTEELTEKGVPPEKVKLILDELQETGIPDFSTGVDFKGILYLLILLVILSWFMKRK